jgi:hypothetical protein
VGEEDKNKALSIFTTSQHVGEWHNSTKVKLGTFEKLKPFKILTFFIS